MICKIEGNEIPVSVAVICKSFMTVADEFGFAPRFTAFSFYLWIYEEDVVKNIFIENEYARNE